MNSFLGDLMGYHQTISTEVESQALSVEEDTILSTQGMDTSTTDVPQITPTAGPSTSLSAGNRLSKQLGDENFVVNTIDRLEKISQFLSTSQCTENEFDVFGQHVAEQLKKLPLNIAIDMQYKICNMLSEARLKAEK